MNPDSKTDSALWYYAHEGTTLGPVALETLQEMLHAGSVTTETLVTREGLEDWQPLSSLLSDLVEHGEASVAVQAKASPAQNDTNTPGTPFPLGRWALIAIASYVLLVIGHLMSREPDGRPSPAFAGVTFFAVWVGSAVWIGRKGKGLVLWFGGGFILACLALIASSVALSPFLPSKDDEPHGDSVGERFESAKAYEPPAVNQRQKAELLTLFDELESFRHSPDFHAYGFSPAGQSEWLQRVKVLHERALNSDESGLNYLADAVNYLEALGMSYLRNKGQETDNTRATREAIEDRTGASRIVTKRHRSDFERILSGTDKVEIGGVEVTNLGDLIGETMGGRIDWTLAERVLISSEHLNAELMSFDDGYLYYSTPDSRGRTVPFALRRTPDIEEVQVGEYASQSDRYKARMRGEGKDTDPLKMGHILVTSGITPFEFSKDKKTLDDYMKATRGKVDKQGLKAFLCRVRVILAY